jgi:hypothetical protein
MSEHALRRISSINKTIIYMKKTIRIFLNAIPVILMIGLIPFVSDDSVLTAVYCVIIIIAFLVKRTHYDWPALLFGFFAMMLFEWVFISTDVERFNRNSLFGVMPLWLPFLWAYGFVAMGRAIKILTN